MTHRRLAHRGVIPWLCLIYSVALMGLLLTPFNFSFLVRYNGVGWRAEVAHGARPAQYQGQRTRGGIEFRSPGALASASPPTRLYQDLTSGAGLSLEVFVNTADRRQSGPARIVSYSGGHGDLRNFTLAQQHQDLVVRLRTGSTDEWQNVPPVKDVFRSREFQHIVVTYDFSEQLAYVNGTLRARAPLAGRFSNWDPNYHLLLGNEATFDRPWLGGIAFVAIYDRALSEGEILKNYRNTMAGTPHARGGTGIVALYAFSEGKGDKVLDRSGRHPPTDLFIQPSLDASQRKISFWDMRQQLGWATGEFRYVFDKIGNILVFIPFGFLLYGTSILRGNTPLRAATFGILIGTAFALGMEMLQTFLPTRYPSVTDLICNFLGVILGIATHVLLTTVVARKMKTWRERAG